MSGQEELESVSSERNLESQELARDDDLWRPNRPPYPKMARSGNRSRIYRCREGTASTGSIYSSCAECSWILSSDATVYSVFLCRFVDGFAEL